jgi:tRNA pseudouridine55 synthase
LAVGWATRLIAWLPPTDVPKEYVAEAWLGLETASQDCFGAIVARRDVPDLDAATLDRVLQSFLGESQQIPPMASALHHEGRRLYDLHRAGIEVPREPRLVVVSAMQLLHWERPRLLLRVRCSAGTYVRTLCHDLGQKLGCGATMAFLVRTQSGSFTLDKAVALEDLDPTALVDPNVCLRAWPGVEVVDRISLRQGKPLLAPSLDHTAVRLVAPDGHLLAMGRAEAGLVRPACVLPPAFADS